MIVNLSIELLTYEFVYIIFNKFDIATLVLLISEVYHLMRWYHSASSFNESFYLLSLIFEKGKY